MLRDLLKEGGLYTLANLLTKGVSLLLIPFYTAYFTTTDYGIIDVLSVFGAVLTTIFSLQLNQGLGRYVADKDEKESAKKKIASSSILVVTLIYILIGSIICLFPQVITNFLSTEETEIPIQILQLSVVATFLSGLFYLLGVYLRFLRKVKEFTLLSFLYALSSILLMVYLILKLDMGISGIYYASIILSPIFILLSLYILRNNIILYIGKSEFLKVFSYSAPLVPASVAYILMNSVDRYYIKEFLNYHESGLYGIAFKFSTIITIIITGFTMAMNPIVFENHADKNAKQEIERMFYFFFGIGTIGLLCLSLFSQETLMIFTTPDYYEAYQLMPIMYFTVLVSGMGMFSLGINIEKKTKLGALIIIISSILNLVLNYYFVRNFGSAGAAYATLISVLLFYTVYFVFSQRYYRLNINFWNITPYLAICLLVMLGVNYFLHQELLVAIFIKVLLIVLYSTLIYFRFLKRKSA